MLAQPLTSPLLRPRRTHRLAVSAAFLLQGLCFSTWAARIPTVQQQLGLSDTELGGVLLAVPVGSMASLPLSGWLVARFGSRLLTVLGLFLYAAFLPLLGLATTTPQLMGALVLFGLASNMANISINTQAVGVEALYGKSIMASFHGLWSLAGFAGAALGTFMISNTIAPLPHFLLVAAVVIGSVFLTRPYLLPADAPGKRTPQYLYFPINRCCCWACWLSAPCSAKEPCSIGVGCTSARLCRRIKTWWAWGLPPS
ncbi:MFS transporter [Hymenobacter sp. 5516J-16]|uniref:MFS transporter n=1 Tax=Hymenobacter sp. 5516J-16 TaxID=2932253 RepID=UPI001FD2D78F|nr:MFS transporter [Hymenobacter sp. 5516J-16]UOQ76933.1 MFS transporter [Hymenobacter sp. 5516J-16]